MLLKVRIFQFMTTFMQVYARPKKFLMGSFLALSIKDGPVKCVKVGSYVLKWLVYGPFVQNNISDRKGSKVESIQGLTIPIYIPYSSVSNFLFMPC